MAIEPSERPVPNSTEAGESPQAEFMTPEEFTSLVGNLNNIVLDLDCPDTGTILRHSDEVEDTFDPFESSTWKEPKKEVEKYDIFVNPDSSREAIRIAFLLQMRNIKGDISARKNHPRLVKRQSAEEEEKELEARKKAARKFYDANPDMVDDVLKVIQPYLPKTK